MKNELKTNKQIVKEQVDYFINQFQIDLEKTLKKCDEEAAAEDEYLKTLSDEELKTLLYKKIEEFNIKFNKK